MLDVTEDQGEGQRRKGVHHDLRVSDEAHATDSASPILVHLGRATIRAESSLSVRRTEHASGGSVASVGATATGEGAVIGIGELEGVGHAPRVGPPIEIGMPELPWLLLTASTGGLIGQFHSAEGGLIGFAVGAYWGYRRYRRSTE